MAYTTIDDPSAHFHTQLYTSNNGYEVSVVNDANAGDFKPDLLWVKSRSNIGGYEISHNLIDSSRGVTKTLFSDTTAGESTASQSNYDLKSFDTNGFTNGAPESTNSLGGGAVGKVAWQWKANGGTTSTNTTGNGIDTVVQANTTAGFSIITYTGNGTQSGQTVGHGLGAVPKMIISKDRTNTSNVISWRVYHVGIGNTKYLELQSNAAQSTYTDWDNTTPTSSVYSVGGSGGYTPTNTNNALYLAYVFADVQGYSRFNSYIGTGNANGPFVYLGFKPAFVMIKPATQVEEWVMIDTARNPINQAMKQLKANSNAAEYNGASVTNGIDILSNGFKVRTSRTEINTINATYIYMAFAENPFVTSTGTPTTAR
jgi:hypothetical protein